VYGFDEIIDQQRPVRILDTFLRKNTIPHALLFTGLEGVGKTTAALTFAMAGNCVGAQPEPSRQTVADTRNSDDAAVGVRPCGVCRSCKKIMAGNHPDVLRLKPSGAFIRIGQIRELCDTLTLKPYEAKLRVVIISDAHTMNPSAANALLKMLEEPPEQTILILTAPQASDLLPTIASRCQLIRFNPIRRESIAARLEAEGLGAEEARVLSTLANGSLTRALDMLRSNWIQRRNWLVAAGGPGSIDATASRSRRQMLAVAEVLANDKKSVDDALTTLSCWLRDILVHAFDPERVVNKDLIDKIEKVSQNVSTGALLEGIELMRRAQRKIASNANLKLTLETMMLQLMDIYNRQTGHERDEIME
jgi:DNA polymerase-3 subunit delta'